MTTALVTPRVGVSLELATIRPSLRRPARPSLPRVAGERLGKGAEILSGVCMLLAIFLC